MANNFVTECGLLIRDIITQYIDDSDICWCRDTMGGACGAASILLSEMLLYRKYFTAIEVVEYKADAGSHCFVLVNESTVIDITATQFNSDISEVYICRFDDGYKRFIFDSLDDGGKFVYYGTNIAWDDIVDMMTESGWDDLDYDDLGCILDGLQYGVDTCKVA